MKQILLIFAVVLFAACGPSTKEEVDENMEVTSETTEKIEEVQEVNVELEAIDGELDSLLTQID